MKTILYLLLLALLSLLLPDRACLADPEPDPGRQVPARKTGKVLLLVNERTMEGDITHVGNQYRIRRTVGETWLPETRVLFLGESLQEAYAWLRSRANLGDADERLRLAGWCRLHGLRREALADIQAAGRLRPEDQTIQNLLAHLEKSPLPIPAPIQPVKHEEELSPPPVSLSEESLGSFATRVQPILMNACASCHATGKGGSYHLVRAYEIGMGDRRITQHNLAATLAQIDRGEPQLSSLLIRSVSIHGPLTQAPLRTRQSHAYRVLEEWVQRTLADNPQLSELVKGKPTAQEKPAEILPPIRKPERAEGSSWGADTSPEKAPGRPMPRPGPVQASGPAETGLTKPQEPPGAVPPRLFPEQQPAPAPEDEDPYNPDAFNRQQQAPAPSSPRP